MARTTMPKMTPALGLHEVWGGEVVEKSDPDTDSEKEKDGTERTRMSATNNHPRGRRRGQDRQENWNVMLAKKNKCEAVHLQILALDP